MSFNCFGLGKKFIVAAGGVYELIADTLINRPSPSYERLFIAIDTKEIYYDNSTSWISLGSKNHIWCGPVVETPSNTLYADTELPEMVYEYNQYNRLDSVFEAEL